ncbi:hypothetical protein BSKO_09884 [Bryopsis sp. KO-2023]|nr:hypothetical protein BSKO_09884 [Bryopsis sp. KO-2023]
MVQTRRQSKRTMPEKEPSAKRKRARASPKKVTKPVELGDVDHHSHGKVPGQLYLWGEGGFGQLGLGEDVMEKTRPYPLIIGEGQKVLDVAAGGMHSVAVTEEGQVWSWGVNDEGALGRLTSGRAWEESGMSMDEAGDPTQPGRVSLPRGIGRVLQVSAGDDHTLLLTDEGTVWGFGSFRNGSGIMGFSPGVEHQLTPVKVYHPASPAKRAVKVSSGSNHAAILLMDGTVMTWGDGEQGQLGRLGPRAFCGRRAMDRVNQMLTPQEIRISRGSLTQDKVVDVTCGNYSTFLITKKGQVFAMGSNNYFQLGESKSGSVLIFHPHKPKRLQHRNFQSVRAGPHHTLGLTDKGTMFSWGRSCYGRLGQSGVSVDGDEAVAVPERVSGLDADLVIGGMSAGSATSGCFSEENGEMWTWGAQECYLLAKGDQEDDEVLPNKVKETKKFCGQKVIRMVFGGQHGVCLAVDRMGG